jgi:tripartite motif-containing protein 2/3/tripartite motif-containing protein 71
LEGKAIEDWPLKSLKCELSPTSPSSLPTKALYTFNKGVQDPHQISYKPTAKGKHQLHIKVKGRHIRGSPFTVLVKLPLEMRFCTPIMSIPVENPYGVVLNHQETELIVSEEKKGRISIFSLSRDKLGEKLRSFSTHGSCKGELNGPIGIAACETGNILIADSRNNRIQMFTADGQFIKVYKAGTPPLSNPTGIAISGKKVYVVDNGNNRVQVLNADLTFCKTFGKKGTRDCQFSYPHGIACDSAGNVYVTDMNNHRIQIFTADGKFVRKFGKEGEGEGRLIHPIDVAVGPDGTVYVSDAQTDRVSLFDSQGQFITSFTEESSFPTGLSVDASGVLYVCKHSKNKVQVFD